MTSRDQHLALRGEVYAAHSVYGQASAAYWAAVPPNRGPAALPELLHTIYATAADLEAAIRALLAYLDRQAQSDVIREEHERNNVLLGLLARELAILPKAE